MKMYSVALVAQINALTADIRLFIGSGVSESKETAERDFLADVLLKNPDIHNTQVLRVLATEVLPEHMRSALSIQEKPNE